MGEIKTGSGILGDLTKSIGLFADSVNRKNLIVSKILKFLISSRIKRLINEAVNILWS